MKNYSIKNVIEKCLIAFLVLFLFNNCDKKPDTWDLRPEDQVITDYILNNSDQYSEFGKLLEKTGISKKLSLGVPLTLFLPTNEAMIAYYKEKNVSSYLDFDSIFQVNLVYNHIIQAEISSGDIGLGAIRVENALGDKLASEFGGSNYADIIINKKSKIIRRDIRLSNGFIHIIDKVIEPVTQTVFQLLESNPSYSIFTGGLVKSGLSDTLKRVQIPYGVKQARVKFTILAVPDTMYSRFGINSVNDLINHFTTDPDHITDRGNDFYRYMEYHCLGGSYYFSDFISKLYPVLSFENNLSFTVTNDYKINFDKKTGEYTGFISDLSNIPAKNGAIHTVNTLLPVFEPAPTGVLFETTDYFDLKNSGDFFGKSYMKWSDGQNTFEKIKWEGDYLQYYYKNHNLPGEGLLNFDCLNMTGFFWIEITTPIIMKGKYAVSGNIWPGRCGYAVYIDGVKTGTVLSGDPYPPKMGNVEWTKTGEHKIKLVAITAGGLFWDTVTFTPIK
jgi:uncharacterized surface protein with fasciclin (FAS1) repeats